MILRGLLIILPLLHAGGLTAPAAEIHRAQYLMGTLCEMTVAGRDEALLNESVRAAFAEIKKWDRTLSTYIEAGEVSMLNSHSPNQSVTLSDALFDVLTESQFYYDQTEGVFDVTLTPHGSDDFILQSDPKSIMMKKKLKFDFGGIGKGYALDRAMRILDSHLIERARINFGGQITIRHPRPETIHVTHPRDPQQIMLDIRLSNGSVASSAQRAHWNRKSDESNRHIIHPLQSAPSTFDGMVTVIAQTGTAADAYATAIHAMGPDRGTAFSNKNEICSIFVFDQTDRVIQTSPCSHYTIKKRRQP